MIVKTKEVVKKIQTRIKQGEHKITVIVYNHNENGNRVPTQTSEGYRITREYDALN